LEESRRQSAQIQMDIRREEENSAALHNDVMRLEKILAEERERSFQFKERLASLKGENSTLVRQKEQLDRLLQEKMSSKHDEEEFLRALQTEFREKSEELQKEQSKVESLKMEIDSLKEKRKTLKNDYVGVKDQLNQVTNQRKEFEKQRDELRSAPAPHVNASSSLPFGGTTNQPAFPAPSKPPTFTAAPPPAPAPALPPKTKASAAPPLPPKTSSTFDFNAYSLNNGKQNDDPFSYSADLRTAQPADLQKQAFGQPNNRRIETSPFSLNNSTFEDEGKDTFG